MIACAEHATTWADAVGIVAICVGFFGVMALIIWKG
jgi:hypothetical protein